MKNFMAVIGTITCGFVIFEVFYYLLDTVYASTSMSSDTEMFLLGIASMVTIKIVVSLFKNVFPKVSKASEKKAA